MYSVSQKIFIHDNRLFNALWLIDWLKRMKTRST